MHHRVLFERLLAGRRLLGGRGQEAWSPMVGPLDEYPIHQVPLSVAWVGTSDRNFYDRCYLNAHDRTGDLFLVTGLGVYPNLGVNDAFVLLRRGGDPDRRCASATRSATTGSTSRGSAYRIEVVEPLRRLRLVLRGDRGHRLRPHLGGLVRRAPGAAPRHARRQPGHPRRPALRPGRHLERHDRGRRRGDRGHPGPLGRHPRPLLGHPAGRRGRARRAARPTRRSTACGGSTCRCGSTTSRSSSSSRRTRTASACSTTSPGSGPTAGSSSSAGPGSTSPTSRAPASPTGATIRCTTPDGSRSWSRSSRCWRVAAARRRRLRRRPRLVPRPVEGPGFTERVDYDLNDPAVAGRHPVRRDRPRRPGDLSRSRERHGRAAGRRVGALRARAPRPARSHRLRRLVRGRSLTTGSGTLHSLSLCQTSHCRARAGEGDGRHILSVHECPEPHPCR